MIMKPITKTTNIDLNLLRIFETVYREGSLTRAAQLLNITQPAVSHALTRMKEQFGQAMFVRNGHRMVPTELAVRMSTDIHQALLLLHDAVHRTQTFDVARDLQNITIAMNDVVEPVILPPLMAALHGMAPGVSFTSARLDRETMRADLAAGRLDCAIDIARPTESDLQHALLLEDDFVVIAQQKKKISAKDYLLASHVTVSARRSGRSVEDIALSAQGLQRRVLVRCQQYQSACKLVSQHKLLLTLPRSIAATLEREPGSYVVVPQMVMPKLNLHLYWHQSREQDSANLWIRQLLQATMKQQKSL